jgi:hypothetical protein
MSPVDLQSILNSLNAAGPQMTGPGAGGQMPSPGMMQQPIGMGQTMPAFIPPGGQMASPGIMPQFTDQLQTGAAAQSGTVPMQQPIQAGGQMPSPGMMQQPQMSGPPTGLIGSEMALQGGAEAALAGLMGGYGQAQNALTGPGMMPQAASYNMGGVQGAIGQGVGQLNPFAQPGAQAFNLQAALSGAMGMPAQQQAYANFQESPGQQYLREQSEKSLLRNQAAIGGLGGGRVRMELQRQAQGLAAQDFDNAFNRLGSLSQAGLSAAQQQSILYGQQAGIAGNLEGQRMGVQGNIDTQAMQNENARRLALADIASKTGTNVGALAQQTGTQLAGGRMQTGQDIAAATGGTISALANLANQQGTGLAETIGTSAGNLANILAGAGAQQGQSQQNLATILANIAAGQGSQVGALPGIPGVEETQGILGNIGKAATGIAALSASDIRLKENIQRVGQSVNGIPLYVWDWNEDGRRVTGETSGFGVIAQEVRETHPEAVVEGEDGWLRVNYGVLNV